MERVVFQLERGSRDSEVEDCDGQARVWFQELWAVTVPDWWGWPDGWAGGAAATGGNGMRNRKLGSSNRGIRATATCFFVILTTRGHAFSIYNNHRSRVW